MDTRTLDIEDEFSAAPPLGREVPKRLISLVLAVLLVAGAGGYLFLRFTGSAEAQVFRYAFSKGEKASYELSMNMTVTPKGIEGAPAEITTKMNATMDLEVVDKTSDGSSVVDVRLRNVFVEPQAGQLADDLGAVRLTIAPNGRITKVEGTGGFMSVLGADPAAAFTPGGGPSDSASSQFFFPSYPADEIGPGDDWTETSTFPFPFGDEQISVTVHGSHEGFDDLSLGRVARIHSRIDMPMDLDITFADLFAAVSKFAEGLGATGTPQTLPPAMKDASMVLSGGMSMEADSYVLPDTGEFVQMDGTGTMKMRIELEDIPQEALGGQPSSMDMEAKFDLSVVRVSSSKPA